MKQFLIKDSWRNNILIGILTYIEDTDTFSVVLDKNLQAKNAPVIFGFFMKQGLPVPDDWVYQWVKERVIPPNRQMLNMYLESLGLEDYSEIGILEKFNGRCTNDGIFLEPIVEN